MKIGKDRATYLLSSLAGAVLGPIALVSSILVKSWWPMILLVAIAVVLFFINVLLNRHAKSKK